MPCRKWLSLKRRYVETLLRIPEPVAQGRPGKWEVSAQIVTPVRQEEWIWNILMLRD